MDEIQYIGVPQNGQTGRKFLIGVPEPKHHRQKGEYPKAVSHVATAFFSASQHLTRLLEQFRFPVNVRTHLPEHSTTHIGALEHPRQCLGRHKPPRQTAVVFGTAQHIVDGHCLIIIGGTASRKPILCPLHRAGGSGNAIRPLQTFQIQILCIMPQPKFPNHRSLIIFQKLLRVPTFNQYEEIVRQLDSGKSFDDFLVSLMRAELENRQESNRKRKIRSARFPYTKPLEEFDFSYLEHVSEAQIRQLASCDFIQNKQNVVMIGNPGTGKTHLSIALGLKACMQGLNVKFYTAANLSNELIEALDGHRLLKLEKQIAGCDLLIIDEMSYLTFNRHQSELLFKVIADRSERKSIIVSTNLAFSEWLTMFENQTMVAAMIDRLTYRSFVLNMNSNKPYRAEFAAQSDRPSGS